MSLWPMSPHLQSLQQLNLLIIQRYFSCYIIYVVKYTYVINPYLIYRVVSALLTKLKFNRCKPFPQINPLVSPQPLIAEFWEQDYFCHWAVVSHSHSRCWWGTQEAEQGNIRYQGDSSHSTCPWKPHGLRPPCGQFVDVIFIAFFTGQSDNPTTIRLSAYDFLIIFWPFRNTWLAT